MRSLRMFSMSNQRYYGSGERVFMHFLPKVCPRVKVTLLTVKSINEPSTIREKQRRICRPTQRCWQIVEKLCITREPFLLPMMQG